MLAYCVSSSVDRVRDERMCAQAEALINLLYLCVCDVHGRTIKLIMRFSAVWFDSELHGMICADCLIPEFWFRIVPPLASCENNADNSSVVRAVVVGYAVDTFADAIMELTEAVALHKVIIQHRTFKMIVVRGSFDYAFMIVMTRIYGTRSCRAAV
jgi:hypothetical protein